MRGFSVKSSGMASHVNGRTKHPRIGSHGVMVNGNCNTPAPEIVRAARDQIDRGLGRPYGERNLALKFARTPNLGSLDLRPDDDATGASVQVIGDWNQ